MRLSSRTRLVHACDSGAWHLHGEAETARMRGEDVIVLTVGDPDRHSPESAVQAAVGALRAGDTHYTDSRGRRTLRSAVAQRHSRLWHTDVCPDSVTILSGAQGGLFAACMALFEAGDEVIVPEPSFVSYAPVVHASGAVPVPARACPGTLRLDVASIRSVVTARTRGLMYADPANPTGAVLHADELDALATFSLKAGLWVISDEIYSSVAWAVAPTSIRTLPGMADCTVVVDGVAKGYAMTGWRVGWTIAPPQVARAIGDLAAISQHGLPGFVQEGALAALEHGQADIASMHDACRRRSAIVLDGLKGCPGLTCLRPEAGMFIVADISRHGMSAGEFSRRLYEATGVAVLDGAAFGESTASHIRLSLCVDDRLLEAACQRMTGFCRRQNSLTGDAD